MQKEASHPPASSSLVSAAQRGDHSVARSEFVKVEKNLLTLGYFTPASKRIKSDRAKRIVQHRHAGGERLTISTTIVPSAIHGLPVTGDQDKYLALLKLIGDLRHEVGLITNPVIFSTAELLRLLDQNARGGKNYREVSEWLELMAATTIISEGTVFHAGKKQWAKDTFHVFDRVVTAGQELEPGKVAECNYVWLSQWQIDNINHNYLVPIDFAIYKSLKNHIAKALVPLLQIWLYATRAEGVFQKRYEDIGTLLGIRQYGYYSEIIRNFGPSLDELKANGYLADWKVERVGYKKGYKVILYHGPKFRKDMETRLVQRESLTGSAAGASAAGVGQEKSDGIFGELTARGISAKRARALLDEVTEDGLLLDQLEYVDFLISQSPNKYHNPPGLYIYFVTQGVTPPDTFESSRQLEMRAVRHTETDERQAERALLEESFRAYQEQEVQRFITEELSSAEYEDIVKLKRAEILNHYSYAAGWTADQWEPVLKAAVKSEVISRLRLLSFPEFATAESSH